MTKALLVKTDKGYFMPLDDSLKKIQPGEVIEVELGKPQQRTYLQNNAIHQYYRLLANAFNDAGFTVEKTLSKPLDISWSETLVKELIWRPVMSALTDKDSTSELVTSEVNVIYEEINNYTASKGVHVAFPSRETFNGQ
tara:strand:+ start:29 stop:445 length:417 start_codon:yes stop_codon:yes gene_type:complete